MYLLEVASLGAGESTRILEREVADIGCPCASRILEVDGVLRGFVERCCGSLHVWSAQLGPFGPEVLLIVRGSRVLRATGGLRRAQDSFRHVGAGRRSRRARRQRACRRACDVRGSCLFLVPALARRNRSSIFAHRRRAGGATTAVSHPRSGACRRIACTPDNRNADVRAGGGRTGDRADCRLPGRRFLLRPAR